MTAVFTCTRRIEFDAAHRVMEHESQCKHVHGHRYVIEATFGADQLDALGRVIDFGQVKHVLGEWINRFWDHNTVLFSADKALGEAISAQTRQEVFYLPGNPTAENMALYLFEKVCPDLFKDSGVRCVKLRLYETPNCYAEVQG